MNTPLSPSNFISYKVAGLISPALINILIRTLSANIIPYTNQPNLIFPWPYQSTSPEIVQISRVYKQIRWLIRYLTFSLTDLTSLHQPHDPYKSKSSIFNLIRLGSYESGSNLIQTPSHQHLTEAFLRSTLFTTGISGITLPFESLISPSSSTSVR